MSLMDTIKGAREEASAAGTPFERTKEEKAPKAAAESAPAGSQQGFVRKSAGKAKPSRQAAAGVRMTTASGKSKSKKNMTKEELKAERKHDREVADLRYNVTQKVLEERDEYNKARKIWWRLLIASVSLMVVAIGLYLVVSNMGQDAPEALGIAGLVVMVLAYTVTIGALIYDWRKIRPLRRDAEKYVESMSEKRLVTAINKPAKRK